VFHILYQNALNRLNALWSPHSRTVLVSQLLGHLITFIS
jgi:hypothetical protein